MICIHLLEGNPAKGAVSEVTCTSQMPEKHGRNTSLKQYNGIRWQHVLIYYIFKTIYIFHKHHLMSEIKKHLDVILFD